MIELFVTRRFVDDVIQAAKHNGLEITYLSHTHQEQKLEYDIMRLNIDLETVYDPTLTAALDEIGFMCDGGGCVYPKFDIVAICKTLRFSDAETYNIICIVAHGEAYLSEKDISLMAAYHREKIARQQYWRKLTTKVRYGEVKR